MLNCTRRKQVERIFPTFMRSYDRPEALLSADPETIVAMIKPLGFSNRRAATLFKLAKAYIKWDHVDVTTLPGVGEYASRAWKIFIKNDIGDSEPNDGALKLYWRWRKNLETHDKGW